MTIARLHDFCTIFARFFNDRASERLCNGLRFSFFARLHDYLTVRGQARAKHRLGLKTRAHTHAYGGGYFVQSCKMKTLYNDVNPLRLHDRKINHANQKKIVQGRKNNSGVTI